MEELQLENEKLNNKLLKNSTVTYNKDLNPNILNDYSNHSQNLKCDKNELFKQIS